MRKHTTSGAIKRPRTFTPGRVIPLEGHPGVFLAPSDTTPEVAYQVDLRPDHGPSCSCKGFLGYGRCKHLVRAQAYSYGKAIQRARRVLAENGPEALRDILSRGQYREEVAAAIARALEEHEGQTAARPILITCHNTGERMAA